MAVLWISSHHKKLCSFSFFLKLLLLVVGIQDIPKLAVSRSIIKSLPGFHGPLPFHLETGYIGVDEFEDVQLFYYFVQSETNPKDDPLILWLTGGPGCSSFTGLAYEMGPLYFKNIDYNGTLPELVLNDNSWTKVANIIFLDLPVGTGFSYGRTSIATQSTDYQAFAQAVEFLRKWFTSHPQFLLNPFYVGGDSYSGISVPIITNLISTENEEGTEPSINLKGYLLGNPKTFPAEDNYQVLFAHGMGLISDELYESWTINCGLRYHKLDLDDAKCSNDVEVFNQYIDGINIPHILERNCPPDFPDLYKSLYIRRRATAERLKDQNNPKPLLSAFDCRSDGYWLSYYWFKNESVREALHIREGSRRTWVRCVEIGNLPYVITTMDSRPYHVKLSTKGFRSLIYSGDHDLMVPFQSTQAWIRDLKYSIIDDWRPWIVQGQNGGYTRTYSNNMTFATVKGGGHTAPEYRPKECFAMFKRWISHQPL